MSLEGYEIPTDILGAIQTRNSQVIDVAAANSIEHPNVAAHPETDTYNGDNLTEDYQEMRQVSDRQITLDEQLKNHNGASEMLTRTTDNLSDKLMETTVRKASSINLNVYHHNSSEGLESHDKEKQNKNKGNKDSKTEEVCEITNSSKLMKNHEKVYFPLAIDENIYDDIQQQQTTEKKSQLVLGMNSNNHKNIICNLPSRTNIIIFAALLSTLIIGVVGITLASKCRSEMTEKNKGLERNMRNSSVIIDDTKSWIRGTFTDFKSELGSFKKILRSGMELAGHCNVQYKKWCFWMELNIADDIFIDKAFSMCDERGGYLANVYNKEHYDLLEREIRSKMPSNMTLIYLWIGMKINPLTNVLRFTSGEVATPFYWRRNYPYLGSHNADHTRVNIKVYHDPSKIGSGLGNSAGTRRNFHGVLCQF